MDSLTSLSSFWRVMGGIIATFIGCTESAIGLSSIAMAMEGRASLILDKGGSGLPILSQPFRHLNIACECGPSAYIRKHPHDGSRLSSLHWHAYRPC